MLGEWLSRIRFLFAGKSRAEVDEEIQFHIERQVEANIALGMSRGKRAGRPPSRFGGREGTREPAANSGPHGQWNRWGATCATACAACCAIQALRRGGAHAGAGHRRQLHHLQPAEPGAAARPSRARSGSAGGPQFRGSAPGHTIPKAAILLATSTSFPTPCTKTFATATPC